MAYQYDQLLAAGYNSDDIYYHAKNLADDEHDNIFYQAYRVAVDNNASSTIAHSFADTIEDIYDNGYYYSDSDLRKFKEQYSEVWQREFYYTLQLEDWAKQGEPISTLNKNNLRKSLGLAPIDELLTYEDEEYLRIKRELIESGVNEFLADQKAYKAVFEPNTPERPKRSAAEQFKQDIVDMLYHNQEYYQDYLDGEL